ncbi:Glyoxalase 3 [Porphyridium purpureum]|uniref:Glyoxalase 3 n=1 Tax=Porphyridium purpureum TaxID=35688 RepID=A0A5J4YKJ2_PORPP|nr:Glyoxalase 3 [Porphyridium purpureum]|eukprot:POR5582..scf246_12
MVKVVIVSTSASDLKGHATGLWIEECATPYYMFKAKGFDVVLASTSGGAIPIDATSMADAFFTDASKRFLHDAEAMGAFSHSIKVSTIDWAGVDAIYMAGGHGTCVDFVQSTELHDAIAHIYKMGKIVAADCHGPIALCHVSKPDGTPLLQGVTATGFADSEEVAVQLDKIVPYMLEAKMKELGAKYEKADDWNPKVCVDGKIVTGQNPQSSEVCAEAVIQLLASA